MFYFVLKSLENKHDNVYLRRHLVAIALFVLLRDVTISIAQGIIELNHSYAAKRDISLITYRFFHTDIFGRLCNDIYHLYPSPLNIFIQPGQKKNMLSFYLCKFRIECLAKLIQVWFGAKTKQLILCF